MNLRDNRQMALISSLASAISVFLPWLESRASASYGGYSSSFTSGGISGISLNIGFVALILALAAAYFIYDSRNNPHYLGIGMLIVGIGVFMGWFGMSEDFGFSSNYGGVRASASVKPRAGLYAYLITSATFAYYAYQNQISNTANKNTSEKSEDSSNDKNSTSKTDNL